LAQLKNEKGFSNALKLAQMAMDEDDKQAKKAA